MHQALRILDKAMMNAQQAKALDETLAHVSNAHQLLYHQYAETMRMHVQEQQHHLLNELQGLTQNSHRKTTPQMASVHLPASKVEVALPEHAALSERHGGSILTNASTLAKTTPMQKTNGTKKIRERQNQKTAVRQVQT